MENQNSLDSWILRNLSSLPIQFEQLTWIESIAPEYHDSLVRLVQGDKVWNGWGISVDSTISMHKALTEAIERSVMQKYGFDNSNGLSGHISQELADLAAKSELLERDLFLCHFYTYTPLPKSKVQLFSDARVDQALRWFKENNLKISVHQISETGVVCGVDARHSGSLTGFMINAGLKSSLADSVRSCTLELLRSCYWRLSRREGLEDLDEYSFSQIARHSFEDHGSLARNMIYSNKIAWLFEGEDDYKSRGVNLSLRIQNEALSCDEKLLPDCPLFFSRASSSDLQTMFTGYPSPANLNIERLSEFACKRLEFQNLNPLPHPFP